MSVTISDIQSAGARIAPHIHRTPITSSTLLDAVTGTTLLFKCENLQRVGAFKARGAFNAVLSLGEEARKRGVATHSSGNHAAALALAAQSQRIPAYVVMPESAPAVKVEAVRAYGAEIHMCAPNLAAREEGLAAVVERTGAAFVPPYDHADIVSGQGTCALEMLADLDSPPDILMTPVGGGGLLSGCAVAAKALVPGTQVIGAEPAGADDAAASFHSGERQLEQTPETIADGLRSTLGELTFALIREHVDDILTAPDARIVEAMRLIWTRTKLIVEPSAAVPLAVVLEHPDRFAGKRVAMVLTGGNVDLDQLPW